MSRQETNAALAAMLIVLLTAVGVPNPLMAAAQETEIEYLLGALVSSDCTFIRNEVSMSSLDFQQHLRSKFRRNGELINSAEEFIDKIATRSAESELPYVALCNGELRITREWFMQVLSTYREKN